MLEHPFDAYFVLALLVVVFAGFLLERMRSDVVAGLAVLALLASGTMPASEVIQVFGNEAPITVASMFVLSAALDRTGVIEGAGRRVTALAVRSPALSLVALMGGAMVVSAFMNNTPVVVILTPIAVMLAQTLGTSASRFLIPLSYASILGGTCTLIGTSTNLVVDGAAQAQGLAPFTLFEITPAGLVYGGVGIAYMLLVGRHLLPHRQVFAELATPRPRTFLTDVLVPHGSPLVGKTLAQSEVATKLGTGVVDVIRNGVSLSSLMDRLVLEAGDRLIFRSNVADVMELRAKSDVVFGGEGEHVLEPIGSQNTRIMEGIVGPRSPFAGRRLSELNLRRLYGAYILAAHRHNEDLGPNFDRVRLEFGDTLLLEGPPEGLRQLFEQGALVSLSEPAERPLHREKGWIAITALGLVIALATLDVLPISGLALGAAIAVVAFGCLEADEAYQAINWPILMLIFGMLAVGRAMESSGAGEMLVGSLLSLVEGYGPLVVLAMVYLATMVLTEFISNNAAAILLTPIAMGVAHGIGADPKPFVVAVMFAASASFSTPIGYQTNTFVYAAGGYRFVDFVRVGLPLNLILWLVAITIIPWYWPL
jgi:di/tricarboxylate transporter